MLNDIPHYVKTEEEPNSLTVDKIMKLISIQS